MKDDHNKRVRDVYTVKVKSTSQLTTFFFLRFMVRVLFFVLGLYFDEGGGGEGGNSVRNLQ